MPLHRETTKMARSEKAYCRSHFSKGDIGFLVSRSGEGVDETLLQKDPGRTNMSNQARLSGWLGSTNNVSSSAWGLGRVVSVAKDGYTLRVVPGPDSKVAAALEVLGYPELAA